MEKSKKIVVFQRTENVESGKGETAKISSSEDTLTELSSTPRELRWLTYPSLGGMVRSNLALELVVAGHWGSKEIFVRTRDQLISSGLRYRRCPGTRVRDSLSAARLPGHIFKGTHSEASLHTVPKMTVFSVV